LQTIKQFITWGMHFSNQWDPLELKTQKWNKEEKMEKLLPTCRYHCILLPLSRNRRRINHVKYSQARGLPVGFDIQLFDRCNFGKLSYWDEGRTKKVIEESMWGNMYPKPPACFCLAPLSLTYHTHLSSITTVNRP
jgi:hypothetical protein